MPRLTKIYTRRGDDGTTALGTRTRVPKDSLRVDAYGTVDELNAMLGLALSRALGSVRRHCPRALPGLASFGSAMMKGLFKIRFKG